MKARNLLQVAMLWLIVIALAACGVPAVKAPAPQPAPTSSLSVLAKLSASLDDNSPDTPPISSNDLACQGLLGIDLDTVGSYYDPREFPIVWTFSLNFKQFSTTGGPIGCVRFFFYDADRRLYDRTPSEVPVECFADGAVTFSSVPVHTVTSVATPFQDVGVAEFHGGRIICKFDLTEMVQKVPPRYSVTPKLSATYVYSYFATAAIGSGFPNVKAYYPILYYEPAGVPNQDLLFSQPISHSIGPYDNQAFYATFDGTTFGPVLNHNSEPLQDWWIYNWPQSNPLQRITFARLQADQKPPYEWKDTDAAGPVHFWTGPATLVIGGGPDVALQTGKLYEVLIDPTGGSKPPGQDKIIPSPTDH